MIIKRGNTVGVTHRPGLGDAIERLVKPAAILAQKAGLLNCLDNEHKLKPESPCAKRRDKANALGRKIGL